MRLLIVTQAVDTSDTALGFFTEWLAEFAKRFELLTVVCLKKGDHQLPPNVRVHSLGKEEGVSRFAYVIRFYSTVWKTRNEYDAVLVHMNQEYVLLAGLLWAILGKRVYLWRNHYTGTLFTHIAGAMCKKVFYTSKFSYTARFRNAVRMPVGIDTALFSPAKGTRIPRSILFFARFAPSKHPETLLAALKELVRAGVPFSASFYGAALSGDMSFRERIVGEARELPNVRIENGVPHAAAPAVFASHDIFVDLAESGMYNKTIFEAAASGCLVLARSKDFGEEAGERVTFSDAKELTHKLRQLLDLSEAEKDMARNVFRNIAERHSLNTLADTLVRELSL